MLPLLLSVLLAGGVIAPSPASRTDRDSTRVQMVWAPHGDAPTPAAVVTAEVERIWRSAGVEFSWAPQAGTGDAGPDRVILVDVSDRPSDDWHMPRGALGGVPLVAGRMRQVIRVSPSAVRQLVIKAGVSATDSQFARLYARTVGRVIAHELGHLLLRTIRHRARGVMRAQFDRRDVLAGSVERFALLPADLLAVRDRLDLTGTTASLAVAGASAGPPPRRRE